MRMLANRGKAALRPLAATLLGLALAALLAPTDLIAQRGAVLRGMVGQYCQSGATLTLHATGPYGDNPPLDVLASTNSTPVAATLTDASGNPIAGETITFTTDTGGFDDGSGGTVTPITATTDASGHATVTLVIGQFANDVTVNITAAWCTLLVPRALPFIPDIFPAMSVTRQSNPGNAGYTSGRVVPVAFTVLNPVAPPAPAVNADYNWPPVPNVKLVAKVGTMNAGAPVENAAYGTIDVGNVRTNADGQVIVTYTPPNADPNPMQADPQTAVVWLEDRAGTRVTSTIQLWVPMSTDTVACPNYGQVYTNPRMNYKNSVADAGINAMFTAKIGEWGGIRDANGRHFTFTAVANPATSMPRGFEGFSNFPTALADRGRGGYGVCGVTVDAYNRIDFRMEYLKPAPAFTALPAAPTGLENVARTFHPRLPDDAIRSTTAHEIAHALGLDHSMDSDAQLSIMCVGRSGNLQAGIFRWFVNGVNAGSARDGTVVMGTIYPAGGL